MAGGNVKIASQQQKGNMIVYTGTTSYRSRGGTEWAVFFAPTQNGVVGMFVGAAKGTFGRNQPLIQEIISSFRVESGEAKAAEGGNQNQ